MFPLVQIYSQPLMTRATDKLEPPPSGLAIEQMQADYQVIALPSMSVSLMPRCPNFVVRDYG
jgi:hypothetical protein